MPPFSDDQLSGSDRDSDQVESDVEMELYGTVYHTNRSDKDTDVSDSPVAGPSCSQSIPSSCVPNEPVRTKYQLVTISDDSDSEPSKSQLIGHKRKRPEPCPSPDSSDSDDDVIFIPNPKFDASDLSVPSISASAKSQPSHKNLVSDLEKKNGTKALTGFLSKCRPDYVPGAGASAAASRSKRKRPVTSDSDASHSGVRGKVSVGLLNSLPGSNSRFKRIRLDPGEDPELWHLNSADRDTSLKQRYYSGRKLVKCLNCKCFTDHVVSQCPFPRQPRLCSVCGQIGHLENTCKRVICGKCFKTGHLSISCAAPTGRVICSECQYPGHSYNDCPNHWRKYCNTTVVSEQEPEPVGPRNMRVSCSVCCSTLHFGFECPEMRSDMYPRSSPFLTHDRSQSKTTVHAASGSRIRLQSQPFVSAGKVGDAAAVRGPTPVPAVSPNSCRYFSSGRSSFCGVRAEPDWSSRSKPTATSTTLSASSVVPVTATASASIPNAQQQGQQTVYYKKQKKRCRKKYRQSQSGPKGGRKENLYTCPDGQMRTWKQLWTEPKAASVKKEQK